MERKKSVVSTSAAIVTAAALITLSAAGATAVVLHRLNKLKKLFEIEELQNLFSGEEEIRNPEIELQK